MKPPAGGVTAAISWGIVHACTISFVFSFQVRQLRPREVGNLSASCSKFTRRLGFIHSSLTPQPECLSVLHCHWHVWCNIANTRWVHHQFSEWFVCVLVWELVKLSQSPGCCGWNPGSGGSSCHLLRVSIPQTLLCSENGRHSPVAGGQHGRGCWAVGVVMTHGAPAPSWVPRHWTQALPSRPPISSLCLLPS